MLEATFTDVLFSSGYSAFAAEKSSPLHRLDDKFPHPKSVESVDRHRPSAVAGLLGSVVKIVSILSDRRILSIVAATAFFPAHCLSD